MYHSGRGGGDDSGQGSEGGGGAGAAPGGKSQRVPPSRGQARGGVLPLPLWLLSNIIIRLPYHVGHLSNTYWLKYCRLRDNGRGHIEPDATLDRWSLQVSYHQMFSVSQRPPKIKTARSEFRVIIVWK